MVAKQAKAKPKKPSKNFPLFAHSRGYWCKKFKGKQYNFGPWEDPQGALKAWKEFEAKHVLGMQPTGAGESAGVSLVDMVAGFLDDKQQKVDRGNLSPRTLNQYVIAGKWFVGNDLERFLEARTATTGSRLAARFASSSSLREPDQGRCPMVLCTHLLNHPAAPRTPAGRTLDWE